MYRNKKVVVVLPAYNAARTLRRTYYEIMEQEFVDTVILVDDASKDDTVAIARSLPKIKVIVHEKNRGYGANQKTCYEMALREGADIVVMVHPDYQYTPALIPAMVSLIGNELYHCVLGSRILGGRAIEGGMPIWKYVANRVITFYENLMTGAKLSEYHSGYRAFSRYLLETVDWRNNSDGFVFDNEFLLQIIWHGFIVAEITCPTRYFPEASSVNFRTSVGYGIGCIKTATIFRLAALGLINSPLFPSGKRLSQKSPRKSISPLCE